MTTFYKIRHKETGKFYTPVKGRYRDQTNITSGGKVYNKKPTLEHLKHGYHMVVAKQSVFIGGWRTNYKPEEHFEIVTYEMVEVKV